jgi:DNA repair exonuclease SbcCD ATPase subunit
MTDRIGPAELAELERLCGAATPGPEGFRYDDIQRATAVLAAAAKREVPRLLSRIAELEAALKDALVAAEEDGLHGGDYHDDECPVCGLIANARAALPEEKPHG